MIYFEGKKSRNLSEIRLLCVEFFYFQFTVYYEFDNVIISYWGEYYL